jgi:uroporphyrinogen decarboxylase
MMTSKERVLTTFARQVPDRVPINYADNPGLRERLLKHFGLAAGDQEGLHQRLGVDFRFAWTPYTGPRLHPEIPDRQVDALWGMRKKWVGHESGGYWDFCDYPLKDAPAEVFDAWPMPAPDDFDYSLTTALCRQQAGFALHIGHAGYGDILNSSGMLMGVEQAMMDIIDPDAPLQRFTDRRLAVQLGILERQLVAGRGGIDFLWIGEDLGTQRGPIISLETYRRFIKPRHQKFVDLAKSFNIPVMIHCCGSSSWAFDDFIEMGIGVVDTLQPEAKDMAPAYLKKRYGDRLAFHGMISTAGPVAYGTVADVVRNCRETLEIMMPGGGYAFAPTHQLQDNSPTENVVAMYETARQYGRYA